MKNTLVNNKEKTENTKYKIMLLFAFILHIGVFIYFMVKKPIHIDEAMTVLNANSLAKSGADILGEKLPIYFDTWLHGGQSPFATYLVGVMIKLFGYSLFVTRVPMFVFSMLGLIAFYKFLKEVIPENETLINIAFCLACISPWHLYSSAFTLDCNFLPHIAMFGMYFLAKGINSTKSKYFVFSMLFFGLGFYCYILSAIIIPILLAVLFLILLIKKKVSFKNTIISVITIFIVAIPFILQGLVQFGIIENLNFLGFSISKMPYYNRAVESSSSFVENVISGFAFTVFPDLVTINSCSFNYQNSFGGILLLLGIIYLIITRKKELLRAGADKISVNSAAVRNPDLINEASYKFGAQCVVCAIDAKRDGKGSWEVYLNGGRIPTGINAVKWAIEAEKRGAGEILLTSMDQDGQKTGYDIELTRTISENTGIPVIASGGAGKAEHFLDAFTTGKADAVLAASLFHFNELPIPELKKYLKDNNISVRI